MVLTGNGLVLRTLPLPLVWRHNLNFLLSFLQKTDGIDKNWDKLGEGQKPIPRMLSVKVERRPNQLRN